MNPQLVVQDLGGVHNQDLDRTSARLLQGGSWKKQRVIVVIPAADSIPAKCSLALWNLAFPPNNGVVKILALGMEVGDAYSSAIDGILAHPELKNWEYLLTVEHDNAPPQDGVIKLIERLDQYPHLAAIGGLYFTKGEGGVAQIWGDPLDMPLNFRPQPPDPNGGVKECCGLGMGFTLYRLHMFHDARLQKPWFRTLSGKNGEGVMTQDLAFWMEARKYGYRCAVDCGCKVGHYDLKGEFGSIDMMW